MHIHVLISATMLVLSTIGVKWAHWEMDSFGICGQLIGCHFCVKKRGQNAWPWSNKQEWCQCTRQLEFSQFIIALHVWISPGSKNRWFVLVSFCQFPGALLSLSEMSGDIQRHLLSSSNRSSNRWLSRLSPDWLKRLSRTSFSSARTCSSSARTSSKPLVTVKTRIYIYIYMIWYTCVYIYVLYIYIIHMFTCVKYYTLQMLYYKLHITPYISHTVRGILHIRLYVYWIWYSTYDTLGLILYHTLHIYIYQCMYVYIYIYISKRTFNCA